MSSAFLTKTIEMTAYITNDGLLSRTQIKMAVPHGFLRDITLDLITIKLNSTLYCLLCPDDTT